MSTTNPPFPDVLGPVRYPGIKVQLTGEDGNAFFILGKVQSALRKAGVPKTEVDLFQAEATSGDYDHLLSIAMKWVDCL